MTVSESDLKSANYNLGEIKRILQKDDAIFYLAHVPEYAYDPKKQDMEEQRKTSERTLSVLIGREADVNAYLKRYYKKIPPLGSVTEYFQKLKFAKTFLSKGNILNRHAPDFISAEAQIREAKTLRDDILSGREDGNLRQSLLDFSAAK